MKFKTSILLLCLGVLNTYLWWWYKRDILQLLKDAATRLDAKINGDWLVLIKFGKEKDLRLTWWTFYWDVVRFMVIWRITKTLIEYVDRKLEALFRDMYEACSFKDTRMWERKAGGGWMVLLKLWKEKHFVYGNLVHLTRQNDKKSYSESAVLDRIKESKQ